MKKHLLAVGIVLLFICVTLVPVVSSIENTVSTDNEQFQTSSLLKTRFWVFGFILGEFEIEEIKSCEQIGNTKLYTNVEITGTVPYDRFFDSFSVGKWIYRSYAGERITFTAAFLKSQAELLEGETVDFGEWYPVPFYPPCTFGIGLKVTVIE